MRRFFEITGYRVRAPFHSCEDSGAHLAQIQLVGNCSMHPLVCSSCFLIVKKKEGEGCNSPSFSLYHLSQSRKSKWKIGGRLMGQGQGQCTQHCRTGGHHVPKQCLTGHRFSKMFYKQKRHFSFLLLHLPHPLEIPKVF